MDGISAIVSAISLGAAAGLQTTATEAVKEGYAALKRYLAKRMPATAPGVEQLEAAPDSKARQAVVEEDLGRAGADRDGSLLTLAQTLLEAIQAQSPEKREVIGVHLAHIKGASLRIADVDSTGSGVVVDGADVAGDIDIRGVGAGQGRTSGPKS